MRIFTLICLAAVAVTAIGADLPRPQEVRIQPASDEGKSAMKGFKLADGLSVDLIVQSRCLPIRLHLTSMRRATFTW